MAARRARRHVALLLATLLAAALAQAAVFVYYPLEQGVSPVPPPIIFLDPNSTNTDVSLGPNSTSAVVVAKAQAGTWEITYNSGFDTGPNGWYFSPGAYLTSGRWEPAVSDGVTTEYGVVNVSGYIPRFVTDRAYVLQYVTVPNASISSLSATINIFSVFAGTGISIRAFQVGLYDPDTATTVWSSPTYLAPTSWTTYTFAISASSVTPGKTYIFYVYLYARVTGFFSSGGYAYFYIDLLQLNATLLNPYYTNVYLLANVTDGRTYESRLVLVSLDYTGAPNITLRLANMSNAESTPIVVSQGSVTTSATSWLETGPAVSGYTSLRFHLDASIDPATYANMTLLYQYRLGDGVIVSYPVQLNVTDPPVNVTAPAPLPEGQVPRPDRLLAERLMRHRIEPIRVDRGARHGRP